jgi:hypothetical protein
MELWKSSMLIIGVVVLILSSIPVSAETETDPTGDIYHWRYSETAWGWGPYEGDKPNIDITSVSYEIDGQQATLTLTVDGSIQDSENFIYYVHIVSEEGTYQAFYTNGVGMYTASEGYSGYQGGMLDNPVSGNAFTAVFDIQDTDATFTVWGQAIEYESLGDTQTSQWWGDWGPTTYAPWYTGEVEEITCYRCNPQTDELESDIFEGDECPTGWQASPPDCKDGTTTDENGNGTPGFEALALIAAVAIALIILKRRK